TRPTDTTPADNLAASHFTLTASSVANHINSPDKQRDGVYGTARTMVRFMTNPVVTLYETNAVRNATLPVNDVRRNWRFTRSRSKGYSSPNPSRGRARRRRL
ncbi:MAG: hypothetical protein L0H19_06085, partial [Salinisphaera sp.]|nr:hypothetical protein [Salinisphaera sp.]